VFSISFRLNSTANRVEGFCGIIRKMAKSSSESNSNNFEITCPCCSALLKVDMETRSVIAHTAAVKPRMFNDMEDAARAMKEQDTRRESIFRQSVEAQKHASELLEKKFQEAVKKAKESPDTGKPIRDFNLD
jgi:molecular chaperone DnaK (HSP70)